MPGSVALKFLFLFALDIYFQFCIYQKPKKIRKWKTTNKLESFIKFILKLVMMLLKRKLKNIWNFICITIMLVAMLLV